MEYSQQLSIAHCTTRQSIIEFLYTTFAREIPGTPIDTSYYTYYVEDIADGSKIFLRRPAPLNKGVDFTINSDNYTFLCGTRNMHCPSHPSIFAILSLYCNKNQLYYDQVLKPFIHRIYDVDNILDIEYRSLQNFSGIDYPTELLVKLLKWLFIEQDVTYWNKSGRAMLMDGLKERNLA